MASFIKQYSQAIIESLGKEKCQELLTYRVVLEECFKDLEFKCLIENPFIDFKHKSSIVSSVLKIDDEKIQRVFFVVSQSGRLHFILDILDEIQKDLNLLDHKCSADIFSCQDLDPMFLQDLAKTLEEKTGYKIDIIQKYWKKEGIKCSINELGLEISFSKEKLMQEMQSYILDLFMKGVQVED